MVMGNWSLREAVFLLGAVKDQIVEDRVLAVSAGVTFYALLAVFPALTALISLFGLLAAPAQVPGLVAQVAGAMPVEAATLLTEQATRIAAKADGTLSLAALVAVALALWSANGGTKALIEALGIAHDVPEQRGFLRLTLVALAFTLGAMVLVPLLALIVAGLPVILEGVMGGGMAETVMLVLRWPLLAAILLGMIAVIYHWGPDRRAGAFHWISPGAVVAVVGLIATSAGLGWYTASFGSYDETYGSLAAVVVLMLWIWLSTAMVLIGAELNAELDRRSGRRGDAAARGGFSLPAVPRAGIGRAS